MRTSFRIGLAAATAALLAGCAYPVTTTEQGGPAAGLYFPKVPAGAHAVIDGADAGEAAYFDGHKLLTVSPGPHRVVVQAGPAKLYDQTVYVGDAARVAIKVPRP